MSITLVRLQPDCEDRAYFEQVNQEAFPPYERMDMSEMFAMAAQTDTDVLGLYADGMPVGFVLLLKNAQSAYLYYLAIDGACRSKGYGGAALRKVCEGYSHLQIVLDFEELDDQAENYPQRLRRKQFYLRNGFHETGRYTLLSGNRFEVVCNAGTLRTAAFQDLLQTLHAHRPAFSDRLI